MRHSETVVFQFAMQTKACDTPFQGQEVIVQFPSCSLAPPMSRYIAPNILDFKGNGAYTRN